MLLRDPNKSRYTLKSKQLWGIEDSRRHPNKFRYTLKPKLSLPDWCYFVSIRGSSLFRYACF